MVNTTSPLTKLGRWSQRLRYRYGRRRALSFVPRLAVCAEIGVWQGDFSEQVIGLCHPSEFHLIDPWQFNSKYPSRWYGGDIAKNQEDMDNIKDFVCQRFAGNSAVKVHRAKSIEAAVEFPMGYFDWIYIDGDHSQGAVLSDLEAWHLKLKSRGIIALDDYDWQDEQGGYSIRNAVDTFIACHPNLRAQPISGQVVITNRIS